MSPRKKDDLFNRTNPPSVFKFDESVARVFDNMLERSIPLYKESQRMVIELSRELHQPNTTVYDLGCSTGTLIKQLAQAFPKKNNAHFVGIDNSLPMLKKAKRKLKDHLDQCEFIESNLESNFPIENTSVVILNYTLQFVRPKGRPSLLKKIHKNLNSKGGLILIEKVLPNEPDLEATYVNQYEKFKQKQGYSRMEISRKREALENVLVPLTADKNFNLLKKAGFNKVELFFKWFNFAGWVAVKS